MSILYIQESSNLKELKEFGVTSKGVIKEVSFHHPGWYKMTYTYLVDGEEYSRTQGVSIDEDICEEHIPAILNKKIQIVYSSKDHSVSMLTNNVINCFLLMDDK